MRLFPACFLCILVFASCTSQRGMFGPRSPHKQYEEKLKDAGLHESAMGRSWITAAEKSLSAPVTMQLPFAETGYFEAGRPQAAGYIFTARRGEKLLVRASRKPSTGFLLFVELWQQRADGPKLMASADTLLNTLEHEVKEDGNYILRLQPELLGGGEYSINITGAASLAFPVSNTKARIGSFWGDDRDGGVRSHEGVDIFGSFRTPVVAAADGYVSSVTENNLGGKVVFMRPSGKDYTLYYAHLDSQLATSGQRVSAGDPLGLMGNTGNARSTPTHLHFGIYASGGAIDPLPFIQQERPKPLPVTAPLTRLNTYIRAGKNATLYDAPETSALQAPVPLHTLMQVLAATENYYKVQLPDGSEKFVMHTQTGSADDALRSITLQNNTPLFDRPDSSAARKTMIAKGQKIKVNALFSGYYYVAHNDREGWIPVPAGNK